MTEDIQLVMDTSAASELFPAAEYALRTGQMTVDEVAEVLTSFCRIGFEYQYVEEGADEAD